MILSSQKIAAVFGLAISFGLASCQQDSLITPDQPTAGVSQAVSHDISPTLAKNYKLTQCGETHLTYYADGRLKQVMYGSNVRGSQGYRREYTYDDVHHTINATSYLGSKTILIDTYYLDEQTGLCHQSEEVDYTLLDKPSSTHTQLNSRWYYQYNEKGQLKRCQNLFLYSSDRTEYTYNADDDLIKTVTYDRVAGQDGVPVHTLTFTYNQLSSVRGAASWIDMYPLNASWIRLPVPDESNQGQPVPDQYLQIFGKPSKHLVTSAVQTQLSSQRTLLNSRFTYKLNADGYVTERKELDIQTSSLLEAKPYDYQVTTVGVQF